MRCETKWIWLDFYIWDAILLNKWYTCTFILLWHAKLENCLRNYITILSHGECLSTNPGKIAVAKMISLPQSSQLEPHNCLTFKLVYLGKLKAKFNKVVKCNIEKFFEFFYEEFDSHNTQNELLPHYSFSNIHTWTMLSFIKDLKERSLIRMYL